MTKVSSTGIFVRSSEFILHNESNFERYFRKRKTKVFALVSYEHRIEIVNDSVVLARAQRKFDAFFYLQDSASISFHAMF